MLVGVKCEGEKEKSKGSALKAAVAFHFTFCRICGLASSQESTARERGGRREKFRAVHPDIFCIFMSKEPDFG